MSGDHDSGATAHASAIAASAALAGALAEVIEELVESKSVDAERLRGRLSRLQVYIGGIDKPAAELIGFVGASVGLSKGETNG